MVPRSENPPMKQRLVIGALVVALSPALALAQSAPARPQTRALSPSLALVGLVTMIGGFVIATPRGETYRVLDSKYCVNTYSVDAGACSVSSMQRKVGFSIAGAGAGLMLIGLQRVKVSPTATGLGAQATVAWGR